MAVSDRLRSDKGGDIVTESKLQSTKSYELEQLHGKWKSKGLRLSSHVLTSDKWP